jgi:hypothetical protein
VSDYPRSEIEAHFARWRDAVDRHDLEAMARMLAEDARGGNAVFGRFEGRAAIMQFWKHWPDSVPNRNVWCVIDGSRVVAKWRETLPGTPPEGSDYHYYGISEFIYAGNGQWSFIYSLPDQTGLVRAYARWRKDGHVEAYGEIYPGMPS